MIKILVGVVFGAALAIAVDATCNTKTWTTTSGRLALQHKPLPLEHIRAMEQMHAIAVSIDQLTAQWNDFAAQQTKKIYEADGIAAGDWDVDLRTGAVTPKPSSPADMGKP